MSKKARALVIHGDGINCENETVYALELAGLEAQKLHCTDLLESPKQVENAQMLVFPGGFSFGDEIASGKVLALKLKEKLQQVLHDFIDADKVVLGICNGFQVLVQLEILPDSNKGAKRSVSLCHNEDGKFINKWVKLSVRGNSWFFKGLQSVYMPIRHGEGRLTLASDISDEMELRVKSQSPLRYEKNINGSFDRIAALCNESENVLGLMPHPEAFVRWNQHPAYGQLRNGFKGGDLEVSPDDLKEEAHGLQILKNAVAMLN